VNNATDLPVYPLPFLPFKWRTFKPLRWLDRLIWQWVIKAFVVKTGVTHVIVTHPFLGEYLKKTKAIVIYDCHDDNAEFYPPGPLKTLVENSHSELLRNSALNIFSANYLQSKYSRDSRSLVIRNGHTINLGSHLSRGELKLDPGRTFNIFYFGTISEWFDFDLLLYLLDCFDNLTFTLIGPSDIAGPNHPRLKLMAPLNHRELLTFSRQADAFIMPFKINSLIEGVDPVKLYEYLSYDVPVLTVYYEELSHFKGLVDFYRNSIEAYKLIESYMTGRPSLIDRSMRDRFLKDSTWRARARQYAASIEAIATKPSSTRN